jgi:hypothetical protein
VGAKPLTFTASGTLTGASPILTLAFPPRTFWPRFHSDLFAGGPVAVGASNTPGDASADAPKWTLHKFFAASDVDWNVGAQYHRAE